MADSKVLQKYGGLVGLWQKNLPNYGGLFQVSCDLLSGRIIGTEWVPPKYPYLFGPLRRNIAFSIEADPMSDQLLQHCFSTLSSFAQPVVPHSCEIAVTEGPNKIQDFRTKCSAPFHHQNSVQSLVQEESGPEPPDDDYRIALEQKFSQILSCMYEYSYTRLEWPLMVQGALIQPGIFKGDFDTNGIELVMLAYEEDGTKVTATKISGDTCVPYGKVAFEANLLEAVVLREDQQSSMEGLRVADIVQPTPPLQLPMQPFAMPEGVTDCVHATPNTCRARFFGLAQIAYEGYKDPVFISGHWVVFNEDLIGFLYFELSSFALYHRVQEKFL